MGSLLRQGSGADVTVLTGATGFIGGELLLRLLERRDGQIVCLVRAANAAEAAARGAATLRTLLGRAPAKTEVSRVAWVPADLEEPGLGLSPRARRLVSGRMTEVFHCAASVGFDVPLEAARRINVDGVVNLIELADEAGPRFRRFHHVSTAFVAGLKRGRVNANFLPRDEAKNFRNTYERTKAQAERYLRSQERVPVTIYRPSIVAGDTRSGRTTNWNVVYVPMRQIAQGRLPFLRCGGKALVDTVGIDFVVDGMLALAEREAPRVTAYHLTASEQAFDVRRYVDACVDGVQRHGRTVATRTVTPTSWWLRTRGVSLLGHAPERFGKLRAVGTEAKRGLDSFRPYEPYTAVNVEFEARYEELFLAAQNIRMPAPDSYLRTIIDFALRTEFGRAERTSSEPKEAMAV